jgi:TRAP-type C4-dicarboxylate transport system substrate-binding protein
MGAVKKRHQIFYSDDEWDRIKEYSKKIGKSASELVRELSLSLLMEREKVDLAEYIRKNCEFVNEEEENEIMELLKDVDPNDEGVELTLEDILQS